MVMIAGRELKFAYLSLLMAIFALAVALILGPTIVVTLYQLEFFHPLTFH